MNNLDSLVLWADVAMLPSLGIAGEYNIKPVNILLPVVNMG